MFSYRSNMIRNTFSFMTTIFIMVMVFGLPQIGMDTGGTTMRCPFSGHSMSICSMNPLEHIEEWQSMFTALPSKDILLLILSIFLTILALLGLKYFKEISLSNLLRLETGADSFYLRTVPIPNSLQEAFSQGILNPKLFWRHN